MDLFTSHKIYTEAEMEARYETILEEYSKTLNIEALTMSSMVRQDILPAVSGYVASLADAVGAKRGVCKDLPCAAEVALIEKLSGLMDQAYEKVNALDSALEDGKAESHNALNGCHLLQGFYNPRDERIAGCGGSDGSRHCR